MKRFFLILAMLVFALPSGLAQTGSGCDLDVTLVDQDPSPATPGEYVDLLFQVTGVDNPSCGDLTFKLNEDYPLVFDPGFTGIASAKSGVFAKNFRSFWVIPFQVRVDSNALDGKNPIEVTLTFFKGSEVFRLQLDVADTKTDFEVSIRDYDFSTNILTLEILNVGENDIEALTVEIPQQENIEVKGSKRNIIGSLDSNEDTTFTFEGKPKNGEIKLTVIYTDIAGERRTIEKIVVYNSSYFTNRARDSSQRSTSFYLLVILVIAIIAYFGYNKWKKHKARKKHHTHHSSHPSHHR